MKSVLRLLTAVFALAVVAVPAATAQPLKIDVKAFALAPFQAERTQFGRLDLISAVQLISDDPRFGGFSGLALSPDGSRLVAVSDDGWLLTARVVSESGRLTGLDPGAIAPFLGPDGKRPSSKLRRDAEALAVWDGRGVDGPLLVGFESKPRVELVDPSGRHPARRIAVPEALRKGPANGELEALARFQDGPRKGWFIAISERNFDAEGHILGWLWHKSRSIEMRLKRHGDYVITDMALLPGGSGFITVERSFAPPQPPGMALRRFTLPADPDAATMDAEVLFEGRQPFYAIDNMEGIALSRDESGRLIVTVISDDNFNRTLQRTIILRFALKE